MVISDDDLASAFLAFLASLGFKKS
jgi:hypothetical protein